MPAWAAESTLRDRGDLLGRSIAFALAVQRTVGRELLGGANNLPSEGLELESDARLPNAAICVEGAHRPCDRDDVRHGPAPECPDRELHRVDGLKPLRTPCGADEPDHLVVKEGRIPIAQ